MKMKKKLALILAFAMIMSTMSFTAFASSVDVWDGSADTSWYNDADTEFALANAEQLAGLAELVNGGNTFEGKTITLETDIDLSNKTWTPIGTSIYDKSPADADVKMFAGNFDGNGYTITGLTAEDYIPAASETNSTEYSFGLFGYVYGANISNVNLEDVSIDCTTRKDSDGRDVGGSGVAALVGYYFVADGKTCVIENCHVLSGSVTASNNMGGLIGFMDSQTSLPSVDITIRDCSNAADVTTEAREAGGILGLINGSRERGVYTVTMRGTITFENCINTGNITSLGSGSVCAGGILGRDQNEASGQRLKIVFDGCTNAGTITAYANGETHVSGLGTSFYSHGSWMVAKNSSNTGDIIVYNPENTGRDPLFVGGLFAYAGVIDLINSTSTGSVTVGDASGNAYVGDVNHILFLEEMDDYADSIGGYTYYLNGGYSPEYAALVDDVANNGGNFNVLVKTAYLENADFEGWYDNPECNGSAYTALDSNVRTYYAKWSHHVAKINDVAYASLQEAIDSAATGDTIKLIADIELTEKLIVAEDDKIVLDLNGKIIDGTGNCKIAIASYGDLTLKDSSEEGNGTIKAGIGTAGNAVNVCGGNFVMESGNIYSLNNAILIDEEEATVTIRGGKITAEPTTRNSATFYISSTSDTVLNIDGGEIVGYNGILLWNNTTINITGGSIDAKGSLAIQGNGSKDNTDINISGGKISGYYAAIYHPQGGTLDITGGELSGWSGVVVKGGTVNISDGIIYATGEAGTYEAVSSGFVDTGDALYVEHYDDSTNSENYGTPSVTVTGGTFSSVNGKAVASYANSNKNVEALTGFISGGTFSSDVSAYTADGFRATHTGTGYSVDATTVTTDAISIVYREDEAKRTEEAKVYDIIVKAEAGDAINELASVDLSFVYAPTAVGDGNITFTVLPADKFTMTKHEDTVKYPERYMFNYNGVDAVEDSGNELVVGTITVEGFGSYKISTADVATNIVNATTLNDNLVDSYTAAGATDSDATTGELIINPDVEGKIDDAITVPVRELAVNITFPNNVVDKDAVYQAMTVSIVGGNYSEEIALGGATNANAAYTITRELPYNATYMVTVEGAGYRTARYAVTLNDDKSLNFWNNVMDNALEVEEDKATSATTKNFLAGDIVKDNNINIYDLSAVVAYFGTEGLSKDYKPEYAKYDLNRDGVIDSKDVAYVLVSWGE